MTNSARFLLPVSCLALALLFSAPAGAVDVTSCGQIIPARQTADLIADLDCPDAPSSGTLQELSGIYLERGARLHLNGFTLSGEVYGVGCEGTCTIEGPGTIRDFAEGVVSYGTTKVENVVFQDSNGYAIHVYGEKTLKAEDVTVLDHDGLVAMAASRMKAKNVTIERCWYGIITLKTLVATGLTVRDCGQRAIGAGTVRGKDLTVVDNAGIGIIASKIILADSVVTGNDTGSTGIDLQSARAPKLTNTTCELSADADTGTPFGVCSED